MNEKTPWGPVRIMAGLVFAVSGFVFAWHLLLIPKLIAGIRIVAAGGAGTAGSPPAGFLGAWLTLTALSGVIAWLSGRRVLPHGDAAPIRPPTDPLPASIANAARRPPPVSAPPPLPLGASTPRAGSRFVRTSSRTRSLRDIGTDGLTALYGAGIINPFGPTLNVLVLDGRAAPGSELPVLHLMLNPFDQDATVVGSLKIDGASIRADDLGPLLSLPFGSCPTVLLPGRLLASADRQTLLTRLLMTYPDGSSVLSKVRRFPGDPWRRVEQDVGGLAEMIRRVQAGEDSEEPTRCLREDEATELIGRLLEPRAHAEELKAFFSAWHGAIEYQGGNDMARRALQFEDFARLYRELAVSCDVPEVVVKPVS